jgi:thioredoxin-related protein
MKKFNLSALLLTVILFACSFSGGEEYKTLPIGSKSPMLDYSMTSTVGDEVSLQDLKGDNGTLLIFSCNTCPFVIAWEDRYPELAAQAKQAGIGMALINSNEAKRSGDDSMEEMKAHAEEKGYADIPYLVDANSELANAYGAKTTPHVFLFNSDWELMYEGAIDDNHESAEAAEKHYLKNAMENLAAGKKINPNNTKAIGCSIKRVKG